MKISHSHSKWNQLTSVNEKMTLTNKMKLSRYNKCSILLYINGLKVD